VVSALGGHGELVRRVEEMEGAIERALASGKPAVVHVVIDPVANAADVPGHEEYKHWYTDFF